MPFTRLEFHSIFRRPGFPRKEARPYGWLPPDRPRCSAAHSRRCPENSVRPLHHTSQATWAHTPPHTARNLCTALPGFPASICPPIPVPPCSVRLRPHFDSQIIEPLRLSSDDLGHAMIVSDETGDWLAGGPQPIISFATTSAAV